MSREYHVTLTVDADDDRQARFKAAMLERCGNDGGLGAIRVLGVQHVEVVYRDLAACEACGSVVCQGLAIHAADEPEAPRAVVAATVRLEEIARYAAGDGSVGVDQIPGE